MGVLDGGKGAQGIGNFLFCLALGPAFVRSLQRFRRRLEFRWVEPARGTAINKFGNLVPVCATSGYCTTR